MKTFLKCLIVGYLLPMLCMGAITFQDKNSGGAASTNPISVSVTNNATANTLALVMVHATHGTLTNRWANKVIFGTSGNTNMTCFCRVDNGAAYQNSFWFVLTPPANSNLVSATFGGTPTAAAIGITTYNGVQQSAQPDSTNGVSDLTATVHVVTNITTVANCLVVQSLLKTLVTGTVTDGANQTVDFDAAIGAAFWGHGCHQITTTAAGPVVFTNTFSLTSPAISCMGGFAPAITTTTQPIQTLTGVGP